MEPELPEFDLAEVPEHVVHLCVACVEYVHRATGVALDFTPDTLPLLDHYVLSVREAKEEVRGLVSHAAGAYFGEVVRRVFPSRWHAPEGEVDGWRIEFSQCFLHFNPVAFAREAIEGADVGEGASLGVGDEDVEVLQAALAVFGEMPPEDYYRLATRLEGIGPVVDRLLASAMSRDEAELEYTAEVYRQALDDDRFKAS